MNEARRGIFAWTQLAQLVLAMVVIGANCAQVDVQPAGSAMDAGPIAFRYPPAWGRPTVATVPACPLAFPTDIPDGVAPEHIAIVFAGGRPPPKEHVQACNFPNYDFPELRVFSVSEYSQIWADAAQTLAALKRVVGGEARMPDGEIPYVPFVDAHPAFTERVAAVSFGNGHGIGFLTQWMTEPDAIGRQLVYLFQGFSADGRTYVLGTFPVKYRGSLPHFPVLREEHIEQTQVRYAPYAKEVARILGSAKDEDFSPNVRNITDLLRSIQLK